MDHPLLYEINTRCWLRELAQRHPRPVALGNVPGDELSQWAALGFTHVWLMGVWTTGPRSRAHALRNGHLRAAFDKCSPGWSAEDVAGSPYAIGEYTVPDAIGGDAGLAKFREQLHAHGLRLVLDFVPNHVGLDHRWVSERPELFVQSRARAAGFFRAQTNSGPRWLAHGRDPYFSPWTDTVQLDYRNAETRAAMIDVLKDVARRCDGVRCDMTMLLLEAVFAKTWERFPCLTPTASGEFWADAIAAVRASTLECLLLAEAYWGLEARLQALGFDFTYDKQLYDYLVRRDHRPVQPHLFDQPSEFVAAGAHFLENHDEPRIATLLSVAEHRAAAVLTLGLPGLRLLHDGQLTGARVHAKVHLGRRVPEPPQPEITAMYAQLLSALRNSAVGHGEARLLRPGPAWPDNPTHQHFVLVQWQARRGEFDLVVVNLAPHFSQCYAPLAASGLADCDWHLSDRLSYEEHRRSGRELLERGLYLDLPAHGARVFHFRPAS